MTNVQACDSWKREACAHWFGVAMGSIAGISVFLYASFQLYPEYVEMSVLLEFSLGLIVATLGLIGLIVASAGVCGLVVMKIVTFLAATILLSKDDRHRFLKFRSWAA